MGMVSDAFKRKRMQLHVARPLRVSWNRTAPQTKQPVFIDRPIRSIGRFFGKLPIDVAREAKKMKYQGHRDRPWLEAQYYHFERVIKYANYTSLGV